MNIQSLRYVIVLAEELNYTRAAKRLYISQPTLTQSIQTLERRLGAPLFDKRSVPMQLTNAGKIFVEWAEQVLLSESQMNRRVELTKSGLRFRLAIGVAPHRSEFMLPAIIKLILEEYPQCMIYLEDGFIETSLYEKLANRELDLVIGNPPPDTVRFSTQFITAERTLIAVPESFEIESSPPKYNAEDYRQIRLVALKNHPFILMPSHSYLGMTLRTLCELEEFTPARSVECHDMSSSHALVEMGLGSALIPELAVHCMGKRPGVNYYTFIKSTPHRNLCIIRRSKDYLSDPAERFVELFMEKYHKIIPL